MATHDCLISNELSITILLYDWSEFKFDLTWLKYPAWPQSHELFCST